LLIGLDVGGTQTDAVILEQQKIVKSVKVPTNNTDIERSTLNVISKLLEDISASDVENINISTTLATNSIIENKMAPVGMFIETGPGISPNFLKCGAYNFFIKGCIDHRGTITSCLSHQELMKKINLLKNQEIEAIGVVTKFSTRNPAHELKIKEILEKENFKNISMGHEISGKLNFPRRVFSTYLNSAIYQTMEQFITSLENILRKKGFTNKIQMLKADGGTLHLNQAETLPINTILSGPAASVMGCWYFFPEKEDAILLDIGGTTTDISFLANGVPLFEPQGITIQKYPTLIPAIYTVPIGLGGDSSISVGQDKKIKIGPERKGNAMALGGPSPTPTDAFIYLGLLKIGDVNLAESAMAQIGRQLDTDVRGASETIYQLFGKIIKNHSIKILDEINEHPVYTIYELLHGKKLIPKKIVAIGGPAQACAPILEDIFNIPCYVPEYFSVANAIGAALSKETMEINLFADTQKKRLIVPELNKIEKINSSYGLDQAEKEAVNLIQSYAIKLGIKPELIETDIVESNEFNMVRGFSTVGKNIRVKAQLKPGLLYKNRENR